MTADINYKHLLKWLRNTLLHLKCITLDGVVLTPQLLKCHLMTLGIKDEQGSMLFFRSKTNKTWSLCLTCFHLFHLSRHLHLLIHLVSNNLVKSFGSSAVFMHICLKPTPMLTWHYISVCC
jgi:hypothetical protein